MKQVLYSSLMAILWIFLENIAAVLLFDSFAKRRHPRRLFWVLVFILSGSMMIGLTFLSFSNSWFKIVYSLFAYSAVYIILYEGSVSLGLFIALIFYSFLCCLDNLVMAIAFALQIVRIDDVEYQSSAYFFISLTTNFLIIFVCFIIKQIRIRHASPNTDWRWYCVPALLSAMSLLLLTSMAEWIYSGSIASLPAVACSVFIMSVDIFSLLLVSWMENVSHIREESLSLKARVGAQEESIEALTSSYNAQRKLTHDFRAHLDVLDTFIEDEEFAKATGYIQKLHELQTERILTVSTRHATMDALLNQKAVIAKKSQIDMQFTVNDLSALVINSTDLTVIVSNLLDNAIEASEKMDICDRRIVVKAILEEGDLFFSVRNRCRPVKILDGKITTTKNDPAFHGYGLRNVKNILDKYSCYWTMDCADGWFLFSIELPNTLRS